MGNIPGTLYKSGCYWQKYHPAVKVLLTVSNRCFID
ncbi:hypothetical protein SPAB_03207 [Salmonella enterica subsp. enterica serovar Paratyphi B str. SPB7]|uniref:Uncharacterized protein n=1 Tax=Salmonella paratyphi B (strain ATCC BAA-1250 / SPB7) TaxID=1016998 RepID=A0A6C6Z462_SALPB|nr:hypothetical protein SPAB_03207 [Salmonella enterica subsp. enterica serovar Paratyphi B str. SPB7]